MKTKFSFYKSVLIALSLALMVFSVALAASGRLDTTFNGDGKIIQKFGGIDHFGMDVAVQSNGKVVVVGEKWLSDKDSDFAIARYQANGALDRTFSGDGKQEVNIGLMDENLVIDEALGVAIQTNGKIVVGGQACTDGFMRCDVALARLNVDGTLDANFGIEGIVITRAGSVDNGGYDLALQGNKIVVAGYMQAGTLYNGAVYRYNADGALDSTFSDDGILPIDFGQNDFLNAVTVASGKIYVAGTSRPTEGVSADFIVARINNDGTLDATFHWDGKVETDLGVTDVANTLAIFNGKVVVAGYSDDNLAIAQYTASGDLDATFSGDGIIMWDGGFASPSIAGVAIQGRKLVFAGHTDRTDPGKGDAFLIRYTATGNLDATFGTRGMVLTNWGGGDRYRSVVFKNARIYTVGTSKTTSGTDRFIVARYRP